MTTIPADLPPYARTTTADHPWPVRVLTANIRTYIDKMSALWVEGEITQLRRRPGARVQFFTLADCVEKTSMSCKIWSHALPDFVTEGSRVVINAKPDFWVGNGSLTLHAVEIRAVGTGELLARIEALKAQLAREGLFAPERKRPLPFLPKRIGLICGRNTQALHDVVDNVHRRWASAAFEIREVPVQGNDAVAAMCQALVELDELTDVEVIVFARGGGAVEDLFPFSDEKLVRAAAAAHTPLVSAIGHEKDNPVLDYVADFRASTPTDAAKNLVPDVADEQRMIAEGVSRARYAVEHIITAEESQLGALTARPVMARPETMITGRAEELATLHSWSYSHMSRIFQGHAAQLEANYAALRTLSPLGTLKRGYAVLRSNDHVLSSVTAARKEMDVTALVQDGQIALKITGVQPDSRPQLDV